MASSKNKSTKHNKISIQKLKKKKDNDDIIEKIDTRFPRMFRDESFEDKRASYKKISDMRNLGPNTEKGMHKAGIKTVDQFIKLGWQKTLTLLVKKNPKARHSLFAYALIGALKNEDAFHISEEDKQLAKDFCASLKPKK